VFFLTRKQFLFKQTTLKMGNFFRKNPSTQDAPSQSQCSGCEKIEPDANLLAPYIGKMYCKDCIKAIKDTNRRTMGTLNKTLNQRNPSTSEPDGNVTINKDKPAEENKEQEKPEKPEEQEEQEE